MWGGSVGFLCEVGLGGGLFGGEGKKEPLGFNWGHVVVVVVLEIHLWLVLSFKRIKL